MTNSKKIIQTIQQQAIQLWGEENWRAELARATVEILKQEDPTATYMNRRRQIYGVFERYSCNLDTAIALATAVGCEFQFKCTETKTIKL